MREQHIPGLSVAVVCNGKVLKCKGYGLANVELGARASADTVFQIHSATKSFTAMAVMLLVEAGRADLDAPVSRYLEGAPDRWRGITIRHLLNHTSGIKDFINEPVRSLREDVTEEEVLADAAPRDLDFTPGTKYAYSNTNYHLLAMVIRKVTGHGWADEVRERILAPLGMPATRLYSQYDLIPGRAAGYCLRDGQVRNGYSIAPSVLAYAGGGLCSNARDMATWLSALLAGRILSPSSYAASWSPTGLTDGTMSGYGFGWIAGELRGKRQLSHTGSHISGYTSVVSLYPDLGLGVAVLCNQQAASPATIAEAVAGAYLPVLAWTPLRDATAEEIAFARRLLDDAAAGRLDPAAFSPTMWEFLSKGPATEVERDIKTAGRLLTLGLVERKSQSGNRLLVFRAGFEHATNLLTLYIDPAGKVTGMYRRPI